MSYRPRRTAEMGEGSQSRSSRASRIAQPVRRPSTREWSLERAPSVDRLTVGYQTGSAMKARKPSTFATPLRTPCGSVSRGELMLTAEKEKLPSDKKWIQTQAARIMEYLHCIESALGAEFFNRGGLKTMTIKQFIIILQHFLNKVVGNKFVIGTNYVDDVAKILSQIGYPYPLNKSWLKTPSAPHAYNNVVIMLQWFLQFTSNSDCLSVFGEFLEPKEEYPDKVFAPYFMRRVEDGFILWNNSQDDEYQAIKENLLDLLIEKRTGIKKTKAIQKAMAQINSNLDRFFRNKIVIREDEFNQLDQDVKTKEKLVSKLQEHIQNNQKQFNQFREMIGSKNEAIADRKKRITELQSIISSQEISVEDRNELISKIGYLQQCLISKKNSVSQLQDMGAANQVTLSRLIKQKIDIISKFNNYLHQIFSETGKDSIPDFAEHCLVQNPSDLDLKDQFQRVLEFLEQLSNIILEEFRQCTSQLSELESQLNVAIYSYAKILDQSLTNVVQSCAEADKKLEELNIGLIEANVEAKRSEEFAQTLEDLFEQNATLKESTAVFKVEIPKQQSVNKRMLDMFAEKAKSFTEKQAAENQKLAEAVDRFKNTMDNITLDLNNIN